MSEFKDIIGYHIEECLEQQCDECKFSINGKCKWGLDR